MESQNFKNITTNQPIVVEKPQSQKIPSFILIWYYMFYIIGFITISSGIFVFLIGSFVYEFNYGSGPSFIPQIQAILLVIVGIFFMVSADNLKKLKMKWIVYCVSVLPLVLGIFILDSRSPFHLLFTGLKLFVITPVILSFFIFIYYFVFKKIFI